MSYPSTGFSVETVQPANVPSEDSATASYNSFYMPRLLRSSSLDGVLNKSDAQLEDLLDEEDFTYDLKNSNPKLLDYFSKNPGNIKKLIDYITIMPPDPEDTKRAHKYPFVACEVFETDVAPIMNAFFFSHAQKASDSPTTKDQPDKISLLEYLFAFIYQNQDIDPVLGGYFNKVVQVLFKRNPRRMVEFAYEKESLLLTMVTHLKEKSIAELITLFICYESSQTDESAPSHLSIKLKVLDQIFETLTKPADEKYGDQAGVNAGNILNEIILKHNNIIEGNELINHIASGKTTQKLFDAIVNAEPAKIMSVGDVLSGILRYYAPDANDFGPADSYGYGGQVSQQEQVTQVISQNLDIFLTILQKEDKTNKFETAFGSTVKSIGSGRLKVIEILEKVIKLDNMEIFDKINDLNILKVITDLFNESPWNNILHTVYEQMINTILDKADDTLFEALFEKAHFLEVIIEAGQNPQHELPKKGRKVRKGYMGHIIRMANELVRYGNIDDTVQKHLKANRNWDNFVYAVLKKQNEINNTQIGGYNPRSLVGASNAESSFGSLAESQPMMPMSSEGGFAAISSYEEEEQGEQSPNRAGDIGGSLPATTFDWKESSFGNSVDALVDSIFRKTKSEMEAKNSDLNRFGFESIHDIKKNEETEMARIRFGSMEGRRSFGKEQDLGPKEEPLQGSPEKGTKGSLTKSPSRDLKEDSPPEGEEISLDKLREKNPLTEHMRISQTGKGVKKVKLKLKKGEKGNPLKILEAIDKYKSTKNNNMSTSAEYTFTETSYSEPRNTDSVLEDESQEDLLAKLKEEEGKKPQGGEEGEANGVKVLASPEKRE